MTVFPPPAATGARSAGRLICCLAALMLLLGCSALSLRSDGPRGIYHRVKSGETLGAIARAYHVKVRDLAEINGIDRPDQLEADRVIFIPDVSQVVDDVLAAGKDRPSGGTAETVEAAPAVRKGTAPAGQKASRPEPAKMEPEIPQAQKAVKGAAKEKGPSVRTKEGEPPSQESSSPTRGEAASPPSARSGEGEGKGAGVAAADRGRFIWPLRGRVISRFGDQPNKMRFNGIRIAAAEGAPVVAAAGGLVIYSAYLKGYGETVIIEHEEGFATVYTHLETRTVRKDHRVKKGDRIAFLGKSDNQEDPYLHFEIRHKFQARNPLSYLP